MKTALAEDPRGMKRICPSCGNHYYDLNKRPIICPACSSEFSTEVKVKMRRSRAANDLEVLDKSKDIDVLEDDLLEEDEDAGIVSLDDDEDAVLEDDKEIDSDVDDDLDEDDVDDTDMDIDDDLGAGVDDLDDEEDELEVGLDDEKN